MEETKIRTINDKLKDTENSIKEIKSNLKKLEKDKKKSIESDISQETALNKCVYKK